MDHTDVLVIGGGVIGVAFAASLESTGLLVTVIDQGSKPKLKSLVPKKTKNFGIRFRCSSKSKRPRLKRMEVFKLFRKESFRYAIPSDGRYRR